VPLRPNHLRQHVLSLRPDVLQWDVLRLGQVLQCEELLHLSPDLHRRNLLCLSPGLQREVLFPNPDVLPWGMLYHSPVLWNHGTENLLPADRQVRQKQVRQCVRVYFLVLLNPRRTGRLVLVVESSSRIGRGAT
jgi:hypothetical protein